MTNIKLSPHFKLFEFCVTSSGANVVQANREWASQDENIKKLTSLSNNILEPIRAYLINPANKFNCKFMTITSGVRTAGTKIANASKTSQHNHCEAVDFVVDGTLENTLRLYKAIKGGLVKGLDYKWIGQVILERKRRANGTWACWIHISLKTTRFINQRKNAKRNYSKFPEFFVSLDGFNYVVASDKVFEEYLKEVEDESQNDE